MEQGQRAPRIWLMTDERLGTELWRALERLPRGGGIIFRHRRLAETERRLLFAKVKRIARKRRLLLILAGPPQLARAWGADGCHGREGGGGAGRRASWLRTAPAHDLRQIRQAERTGADLLFLSPVYPTRSHPGAAALGPVRFARLARLSRLPVVALGGMDRRRFRALKPMRLHGWAAIDAWRVRAGDRGSRKGTTARRVRPDQKRKAVPT